MCRSAADGSSYARSNSLNPTRHCCAVERFTRHFYHGSITLCPCSKTAGPGEHRVLGTDSELPAASGLLLGRYLNIRRHVHLSPRSAI